MNARLAPVAALLALGLATSAPALAQGRVPQAGAPFAAVEAGPGWQARSAYTGADVRGGIDASAKAGNANQPERLVPQYGTTSGGPAH